METPQRVRLSRMKGWRMPANTVKVDRSTKWGNPFVAGEHGTRAECVALYRKLLDGEMSQMGDRRRQEMTLVHVAGNVRTLHGRNLACWCPSDEPCHADVLLEIANRPSDR